MMAPVSALCPQRLRVAGCRLEVLAMESRRQRRQPVGFAFGRQALLALVLVGMAIGSAAPGAASITNASNATPIVITSVGHGLTNGTQITVTGVTGNTAANGAWTVTVVDA